MDPYAEFRARKLASPPSQQHLSSSYARPGMYWTSSSGGTSSQSVASWMESETDFGGSERGTENRSSPRPSSNGNGRMASISETSAPTPPAVPSRSRSKPSTKSEQASPSSPLLTLLLSLPPPTSTTILIGLAFVLPFTLKTLVSLGSFSGKDAPPRYGDFEAQRFWMELTRNEGIEKWYYTGEDWWQLDSNIATNSTLSATSPSTLTTISTRGASPPDLITYMRATVLALESMGWWIPVAWWCWSGRKMRGRTRKSKVVAIASILCWPGLILIDNGHFQYNSFMLGLCLVALACFEHSHDALGAIAFSSCILFKQMGLYWSPAVFAYLLGKCIWLGGERGAMLLVKIGLGTVATFGVMFAPFLTPFPDLPMYVLHRIFPLARGIFEDKVANFWCVSNVVIKWRLFFADASMAKVHEKSILVPMLSPLLALAGKGSKSRNPVKGIRRITSGSLMGDDDSVWETSVLLLNVATFSIFPLLIKDGQTLQYCVLALLWNHLIGYNPTRVRNASVRYAGYVIYGFILLHHVLEASVLAPAKFPDIYAVTNAILSFGVFAASWLAGLYELAWQLVMMTGTGLELRTGQVRSHTKAR
ncbi:hypothetical protein QFC21_006176 [Naganishia friedmannii]|uniref:Uncharacterized protein n=1 Tax=Naganishia friedmannii TaxID=89922 RepID=A0ACC2V3Z0_9TREE|nr:hypothetical protein QFC21_006176 [Naganishia friedmannii]